MKSFAVFMQYGHLVVALLLDIAFIVLPSHIENSKIGIMLIYFFTLSIETSVKMTFELAYRILCHLMIRLSKYFFSFKFTASMHKAVTKKLESLECSSEKSRL